MPCYTFRHLVYIHRYRRERQVTIPMKIRLHHHVHKNSATDRTPRSTVFLRVAAVFLSVLIAIPIATPMVFALSTETAMPGESNEQASTILSESPSQALSDIPSPFHAKRPTLPLIYNETTDLFSQLQDPTDENGSFAQDKFEHVELDTEGADEDPNIPLTQEMIARRVESSMDKQVRGGSRIYYPYPSGAMAVDLYKDGKQILKGQVADIGGTVYVPVQRFADLFGKFKTVYTEATEQVVITGTNLSITVKVGDPYITVNERIFYTGKKVISLGGWIFVPLTSMCKALNATVTIRSGYYDAFITSGDTTKVKWASEYYDSTDLYWLSRIISAEAKGEPFTGQIAVGNVVLNRVRSSQYPNTVKGVIFDTKYGTQFSPVASGTIYNTPTASAVMAAKICLEGYSLSTKMIYFYNPKIATSSWIGRTRPYIMTIGNHKFYG